MSINSMEAGPMECPNCKELELRLIDIERDPKDQHPQFSEYECSECKHYQTMDNLDYDPTPDEQGEPPVTMAERGVKPR